jgi:hypothetical protein
MEAKGTEGRKVHLYFTDENGEWMWAICMHENREWWLDTYDTHDNAVRHCESMQWEIVSKSSQDGWHGNDPEAAYEEPRCPYCGTDNPAGAGTISCRGCSRTFVSYEIPAGVVYCTRK